VEVTGQTDVCTAVEDARLRDDHQYVVRAWMAVVAYLLADYRFVYN
jgi:hypothetical protein